MIITPREARQLAYQNLGKKIAREKEHEEAQKIKEEEERKERQKASEYELKCIMDSIHAEAEEGNSRLLYKGDIFPENQKLLFDLGFSIRGPVSKMNKKTGWSIRWDIDDKRAE